ncbi:ABC-2 family transporter protein [compost metagenome]
MSKWLHQFRFELGMIVRNPLLLVMPVLFAVWTAYMVNDGYMSQIFKNKANSSLTIAHTMSLGLVMLMGILSIRRDIRRNSYEWSDALPVSNTAKITSKYVVTLLYFTLFTIVASAIFAYFSAKLGVDASVTTANTSYYALSFEISYAVTLALSMLLAICISNRVVYLIGFCAWMFGTFFIDIFLIDAMYLYPLRTFHLSQLFLATPMNSEVWGNALVAEELLYSRLFVLSFTLLMLVVGITILNCLRRTKYVYLRWAAVLFALLLACGSFIPYGGMWKDRYDARAEKISDPTIQNINNFQAYPEPDFRVVQYDLTMNREQDDSLEVKAIMELTLPKGRQGDALPFTLNRTFSVKQAKVNGKEASFLHQGDQLTITLPQNNDGSVKMELTYAGTAKEYSLRSDGRGEYSAFVKGENVFLPQYIGWYPLPGYQAVYVKVDSSNLLLSFVLIPNAKNDSVYFRLTLNGFKARLYSSLPEKERSDGHQIFEGPVTDRITLFSGRFEELNRPNLPVNVVTSAYNIPGTKDMLDHWGELYEYFGSWLHPLNPKINQLIYLPTDHYTPYTMENKTYMLTQGYLDSKYFSEILMNSMMVGGKEGDYLISDTKEDVRLQIRALLWYVYYREQEGITNQELRNGWGNAMLWELYNSNRDVDPDQLGLQMAEQVGKAMDEGKSKEVKEILNYFYIQDLEIVEDQNTDDSSPNKQRFSYEQWEQEWRRVMER